MAEFIITAPDGKKYKVTGDNKEGALAALKQQLEGGAVPAARAEIGNIGGMAAAATQGALFGAGDEYLAGLSAILGVQPDGNGGARWLDYEKPLKERYGTALEAIRSEMGEYADKNPIKAYGSQIVGGVAGGVAAATAAPVRAATTLTGKAAQMAGGGLVGGAVEGFNSGEGGMSNRLKSGGIGAATGAVFAPIVGFGLSAILNKAQGVYGAGVRRVFANRQMYNERTGALTPRGVEALQNLGLQADEVSKEMQKAFGIAANKVEAAGAQLDDVAVARMAAAERFGVPLTTGQATGDVAQTAAEESMRAGVRGQTASNIINAFDETQRSAVETARTGIGSSLGNSQGRIDAAEEVISGVRREADAARQAGRQAYQALEEAGAALDGTVAGTLRRGIENAVRNEGFAIDAGTPNAQAALTLISSQLEAPDAASGSIPFMNLERVRQRLVGLRQAAYSGASGADRVSIDAIVKEYDGWLDDSITSALISGDTAVLDQAKNARQLWSRYRSTFLGKDGADNFIRKIVEDDLAPDQVAGWLYGSSRNIGGGQTSLVAARVKSILGEESPEWGAVRRAAWDHITTATDGRTPLGVQAVQSNISELVSGKGQTLSRELFTSDEIKVLKEFRNMLTVLVPPRKATNASGSGYQVERGMQAMLQGAAAMAGSSLGGPLTGAATGGAVKAGSSLRGAIQARSAVSGVVPRGASVPIAIGAGVASGAAVQEQLVR